MSYYVVHVEGVNVLIEANNINELNAIVSDHYISGDWEIRSIFRNLPEKCDYPINDPRYV